MRAAGDTSLNEALMHTIWTDLLTFGIPVTEKLIRTLAVYIFLLLGLRFGGKRELGQLNPFDLVVLLVLSNTVQNAIIGNDNSLVGGLLGATVLLLTNYLVVRFLFAHPKVQAAAEGSAVILVQDGHALQEELDREMISKAELEAAARRQGIDHLGEVQCARLEVGGALTFVRMAPTDDDRRHRELLDRLEVLEQRLAAQLDRRD